MTDPLARLAAAWVVRTDAILVHGRHSDTADIFLSRQRLDELDAVQGLVEVKILVLAIQHWRREQNIERASRWRAAVVALRDLVLLSAPVWQARDGSLRPDIEGRWRG